MNPSPGLQLLRNILTSWILMDYNALKKNTTVNSEDKWWKTVWRTVRNTFCGFMHYSNSTRQKVVSEVMTFSCTSTLYSAAQHFVIIDIITHQEWYGQCFTSASYTNQLIDILWLIQAIQHLWFSRRMSSSFQATATHFTTRSKWPWPDHEGYK